MMMMLMMMMMMMLMLMLMLCKSHAQVRDLCVEIYHFKIAVLQKTHFYHVFSTSEDGRRKARANQGVWP